MGDAAPRASCHGLDGRGVGNEQFPRLDGQSARYLWGQLEAYAGETRSNEIMTPIARALSGTDRQAVAAYFAVQTPGPPAGEARVSVLGERLVHQGDGGRGIQACVNCHGPDAAGLPPVMPRLAGQSAVYLAAQLDAFRAGTRRNDVAAVMRTISPHLSPEDMAEVTAYLAGLGPR